MYLVNRAPEKVKYIRDMWLTAEIGGREVKFKRQDGLDAMEVSDEHYDYGLKIDSKSFPEQIEPLRQLADTFPLTLDPGQPVEGWVRFMASNINPDKIEKDTIKLTIIDSLGNQHSINKVSRERERRGEISLRRLRGLGQPMS
jgi:hypothetical protein